MEPEPEHGTATISLRSYARLIRSNSNFRRLWIAQIVSEIGDWFYTLSIYTLLLQLTGHAGSVALALVLQVLPQTLAGPTAGVVNDRIKRKHVMIAADLIRCVIVLAMLLVRSPSMVWLVYPLLLAETTMAAFFEPARSAVIPNIAAPEEVLAANTLSSATWSVNLLIGASVGGLVAAFLGREAAFVLNALSFLVSALLIAGMHFREPHAEAAASLRPKDLIDFSPVKEGIDYIRSHPVLIPAVFAKAGELMVGPSWVIFTVMGAREFAVHGKNIDPAGGAMLGMSILLGGRGLGALIGPLASARWAGHSDHRLRLGILYGYITISNNVGDVKHVLSNTSACTRRRAPFRSHSWFALSNLGLALNRSGQELGPTQPSLRSLTAIKIHFFELPDLQGSGMPNHYIGDLLLTIAMSGLSRVRTELVHLAVVASLTPHPVQMYRQLPCHRYFRNLPSTPHGQVEELVAPLLVTAHRDLCRFHQQEAQQHVALLADVSQPTPISAGLFRRHQTNIAGELFPAVKAFGSSNH